MRGVFVLAGLAAAVILAVGTNTAQAFCGFYVAGADTQLFNNATNVVLMREGTTTVLSMQNDYQGPTEDFAMVVPVPVVLDESNVKTLPREVFARIDALAAPRLVEYWEQNPCVERGFGEGTIGLGNLGAIGHGAGAGGFGRGAGLQVQVEAEFTVDEYDIVILGAQDSNDLETWLRQNGYRIPEGAAEALRPYVEGAMKFFVAKVDAAKVTFEDGRALLSPLRVHYDSETFSLPVRLGMLNSSGAQDLVVHILGRNQRYEMANYDNVTIPTNIDVQDAVRGRFGEFYAALFDRVLERHPNAVVTEYAWQATNCDPCPGPVLSWSDLMTLGADVTSGDPDAGQISRAPLIRPGEADVRGSLSKEVIRRVIRRHYNEVRYCYEQELVRDPELAGRVAVRFIISPTGAVQMSAVQTSTLSNPRVEQCIQSAVRRWTFPQPEGGGIVMVTYPFVLSSTPGGRRRRFGGPPSPLMELVLTRLHYRYGRGELGEDLVFRPAPPITGGREVRGPTGALETGAVEAAANNFQGRYVIRHPWEGAIECDDPQRNIWGGPPAGLEEEPIAATNTAAAPRGQLELGSFLAESIPALGIASLTQPAAAEPVEPPATRVSLVSDTETTSGCGGCSAGGAAGVWTLLLLLPFFRRKG